MDAEIRIFSAPPKLHQCKEHNCTNQLRHTTVLCTSENCSRYTRGCIICSTSGCKIPCSECLASKMHELVSKMESLERGAIYYTLQEERDASREEARKIAEYLRPLELESARRMQDFMLEPRSRLVALPIGTFECTGCGLNAGHLGRCIDCNGCVLTCLYCATFPSKWGFLCQKCRFCCDSLGLFKMCALHHEVYCPTGICSVHFNCLIDSCATCKECMKCKECLKSDAAK